MAAGGEWIESGAYNFGTVNLLLMGAEGVRTATGRSTTFPRLLAGSRHWGQRQLAFWTPDLSQVYQWGDEEHPRDNRLYTWTNASGLAAGLLQGTPIGAQLQQQLFDLVAKYGATGYQSMEPIVTGRLFFTFNPYAARMTGLAIPPRFHALRRRDCCCYSRGVDPNGSLFAAHLATRPRGTSVDHYRALLQRFRAVAEGAWVITHPRGMPASPNSGTRNQRCADARFRRHARVQGAAWASRVGHSHLSGWDDRRSRSSYRLLRSACRSSCTNGPAACCICRGQRTRSSFTTVHVTDLLRQER